MAPADQIALSAADETLSPVDLPVGEAVDAHPLRWTSVTIAVAALFLLMTNAVSIRDWANDLTPSPAQARFAAAAEEWVAITDRIGLGAPRATLHGLWKKAQAARFGDETDAQ
ncbi:hypothetical protein CLG96_09550 [Sphingomonas oleivorans]|uniref:Uncharacterized protein n=1 Tax=Sphingomonas oleivorans TaxID=1735121 RepID=A0A2T5FYQ4_9SPHN|nr:hypothetical protein [Sphingomonas oleivorans]PTQ11645.1 hypothetical protein CLG96_09550 [Sphingomonas oleivorans]